MPTDNNLSQERMSVTPQKKYTSKPVTSIAIKFVITIIWAVCHFTFYVIQQIAEIFAPLFLIVGLIWKIAPNILQSAVHLASSSDPQIRSTLEHNIDLIPTSVTFDGHTLSASILISYGITLIILTAIIATVTAFLEKKI